MNPADQTRQPLDLTSTITCPECGGRSSETMPTNACRYVYDCPACGARLKPKPGDCCVFCSYGDVACPPVQALGPQDGPASRLTTTETSKP
jgi:hypothetical protein